MTVTTELEQALAYCEVLRGNYILMGQSSEDQQAKKTFSNMQTELEQHILFLKDRLEYLNQNNPMNRQS